MSSRKSIEFEPHILDDLFSSSRESSVAPQASMSIRETTPTPMTASEEPLPNRSTGPMANIFHDLHETLFGRSQHSCTPPTIPMATFHEGNMWRHSDSEVLKNFWFPFCMDWCFLNFRMMELEKYPELCQSQRCVMLTLHSLWLLTLYQDNPKTISSKVMVVESGHSSQGRVHLQASIRQKNRALSLARSVGVFVRWQKLALMRMT